MDILKRNIGLLIFLVFSLVAAGIILAASHQYYREVREKRAAFEDHRSYFEGLARRSPGISESNLRTARENLTVAQAELERLEAALDDRSALDSPTMSAVEAKNYLDAEARRLSRLLTANRIQMTEAAAGFSFQNVIQAAGLPEEEREVPALLRQMEVVGRVVETAAGSGIRELLAVERPAGIREIKKDGYSVIRLNLQVRGSLNAIKRLVNNLHEDNQYYFSIPYFQWEAEGTEAIGTSDRRERTPARARTPAQPRWQEPPEWEMQRPPGMDIPRERDRRDTAEQRSTREMRRIAFSDAMVAIIPIHFIEFNPDKEN